MATSPLSFILLGLFLSFSISNAIVPSADTFRYVNQGDFGEFESEYAPTYRPLDPFTFPFQLCFYNTTPNVYYLGLRMGTRRDGSLMRWVWEANRGSPVRENATFSLGSDGNLILAESTGQIVWQTNTANKDVVGFAIESDGNIVLKDSSGNFVWQSFDSPTDTLLVGQSLRINGGPLKLVSRDSITNNVNGAYSFVIEPKRLALYYKNSMRYWSSTFPELNRANVTLVNATLRIAETDYEENNFHTLWCRLENARDFEQPYLSLGTIRYNSSLSHLRLGIDGNLRLYTYRANVRGNAWALLFTLFDRGVRTSTGADDPVDECQLPSRCGKFGLCEESQCIGCPTPNGVFAWSKDCDVKLPSCNASSFKYYELKGVDHFTVKYTSGTKSSLDSCKNKCTKDYANKDVVGFAILSHGNMVLRDSKGNFVWQSFDSPTDTLLVGQTLRINGGPLKLVSRDSITNNVNGAYSFVIEPKRLALYYNNSMRYWSSTFPKLNRANVNLVNATLRVAESEYEENNFNELQCFITNVQDFEQPSLRLGTLRYNSSLSYLRLGIDGNLRFYTYRANVRGNAWAFLYTLFDRGVRSSNGADDPVDECQLPNRCGKFGLCEESQCVGCPTPDGVFAWSNDCDVKLPS
ncbi:epidermis-specific secreted glycoprotein EP1-like protein, partial [Tanacetum coccineum]